MRFCFGRNEYFQFGFLPILYNYLHEIPRMKLIPRVILLCAF